MQSGDNIQFLMHNEAVLSLKKEGKMTPLGVLLFGEFWSSTLGFWRYIVIYFYLFFTFSSTSKVFRSSSAPSSPRVDEFEEGFG